MDLIKNIYQRKDSRGIFQEIINSETGWKAVNTGFMNKDSVMGNHYHKKCRTLFFVVKGSAKVLIKNVNKKDSKLEEINLKMSEGVIFEKFETHAIKFNEDSIFLLLKNKKFDQNNQDIFEAKLI